MLKELSRSDWLSFLDIPEQMVPEILILRGTRNLKTKYQIYKPYFENVLELDSPNGIIDDVLIGAYNHTLVGYASVYGDAMASEVAHIFGTLGTSLVIQTGCCGGLGDDMLAGDVVCASSAHCGEGASQYYIKDKDEVQASPDMVRMATDTKLEGISLHKGPIWTTSALFAEGRDEVNEWHDRGYIGVDMETATTFSVAEYFKMQRLSLLFVFDNPRLGDHILMTGDEKEKRRAKGDKAMIDLTFRIVTDYGEGKA